MAAAADILDLYRARDQFDFYAAMIAFMRDVWQAHLDNEIVFDFLMSLYPRWADSAVVLERFEVAQDLVDTVEGLIERRVQIAGPDDPRALRNRIVLSKLQGDVMLSEGLFDLANAQVRSAQAAAKRLESLGELDDRSQRQVLELQTRVLNAFEDFSTLARVIERAIAEHEWARRATYRIRLGVAHRFLSKMAQRRAPRDEVAAQSHAERAYQAFDEVIANASHTRRDRLTAHRLKANFLLGQGRIAEATRAIDQYEATLQQGPVDPLNARYLAYLHSRANRSSNKNTPDLTATETLKAAVSRLVDEWNSRPVRSGGRGLVYYAEPRTLITELILATALAAGDSAALQALIDTESAGSLARMISARTPTVADIQRRLDSRGILLYLGTLDVTLLFVIDATTVQLLCLPDRFIIDDVRTSLVRELRQSPRSATDPKQRRQTIERTSRSLGQLLLPEPLGAWLSSRSAVTVLDGGTLGYIPFECLRLDDGSVLGLEKPISYASSLTVNHAIEERRRQAGNATPTTLDAQIFADPAFDPKFELEPLPLTRTQGNRLVGVYPEGRAELKLGSEVTVTALRECSKATVVQWLTHGGRIREEERFASLYLASSAADPDGRLSARDLTGFTSAPLVILTACGVGRGPRRVGDPGVSDLSGAFILVGASAVMAPLENIEFHATVRMSEEIHRSLTSGRSPAQALFDARRALASDPEWSDPYYHSLLHVRGDAHTPYLPKYRECDERRGPPPRTATWWIVAIALAAVAAWLIRRSKSDVTTPDSSSDQ